MQIKKYRIKHNLSQKQMAEKLNITQPHYANIENERRWPSAQLIWRIDTETNGAVTFKDFYPNSPKIN